MTEEADRESSRRVAPQSERSSYIRIAAQQLTIAQQRHTLARVEREQSRAAQRVYNGNETALAAMAGVLLHW